MFGSNLYTLLQLHVVKLINRDMTLNGRKAKLNPLQSLIILLRPLTYILIKTFNLYLAFQSFDYEHTWRMLLQKRIVCAL